MVGNYGWHRTCTSSPLSLLQDCAAKARSLRTQAREPMDTAAGLLAVDDTSSMSSCNGRPVHIAGHSFCGIIVTRYFDLRRRTSELRADMVAAHHCTGTEAANGIDQLLRSLENELEGLESETAGLQSMLVQLGLLLPVTVSPV